MAIEVQVSNKFSPSDAMKLTRNASELWWAIQLEIERCQYTDTLKKRAIVVNRQTGAGGKISVDMPMSECLVLSRVERARKTQAMLNLDQIGQDIPAHDY